VSAAALKCLGALALGLRGAFAPHATAVVKVLVSRCRDRKATVQSAASEALDALWPDVLSACSERSIEAIMESVSAAIEGRAAGKAEASTPEQRTSLLQWLARSLARRLEGSDSTGATPLPLSVGALSHLTQTTADRCRPTV